MDKTSRNDVSKKVGSGDYVLSPYSTYKVYLTQTVFNFTVLQKFLSYKVDLTLEGESQWVDTIDPDGEIPDESVLKVKTHYVVDESLTERARRRFLAAETSGTNPTGGRAGSDGGVGRRTKKTFTFSRHWSTPIVKTKQGRPVFLGTAKSKTLEMTSNPSFISKLVNNFHVMDHFFLNLFAASFYNEKDGFLEFWSWGCLADGDCKTKVTSTLARPNEYKTVDFISGNYL